MRFSKDRKTVIRQIFLTLLLVGAILFIAGATAASFIRKEIQEEKYKELAAVANMKVREIGRWITERKYEALFLQNNPDFQAMMGQLADSPPDEQLKDRIHNWVKPILLNHDYCGMHMFDASGVLLSSFTINQEHNPYEFSPSLKNLLNASDSIIFSDIYFDSVFNHYHIEMLTPIYRETRRLGTVVLTINPELMLLPAIMEMPVYSNTFETYLVKREGDSVVFINTLRFADNIPLEMKMLADHESPLPAVKAVLGHKGFVTGTDYRGKKVLAKISTIPYTKWYMVAKIDMKEVYAPFWQRSILLLMIGLMLLTAIGATLVLLWKRNESHLLRHQLDLEKETKALEHHYGYLTKYANDIIMLMNEKAELIQINERGLEKYGYIEDEVRGKNAGIFRAKQTLKELPHQLREVLEKGSINIESIHQTKFGVEFPVEISARSIRIEDKIFIQSIVRDITDRKKYEQAILDRENNLNITLKSIGDAVIVTNENGHITRINQVAEELTGWENGEALGKSIEEVMRLRQAKNGSPVKNILNRILIQKKDVELPDHIELISKSGKVLQIADNIAPINDENNKLLGSVVVFRDVSEKYKQEQVLRESEEKFRLLAESSPVAILIYQGEKWVYANRGATLITGYQPEEFLEMNFWDIVHPDDQQMIKDRGIARQSGMEVPSRYQFRIISKSGNTRWADLSGTLIQFKGKPAGIITVMDITEQKEAMLRIAESESRLSGIFKAAPVGIGLTIDRIIIEVNDRICTMTGYNPEDLIGLNARILYANDEEFERVGDVKYKEIERTGIGEIETRWICKNGNIIDVQLRSIALNSNQPDKGYMFTALDITSRKRSEESVRESQRTLSTLMSNLPGIVYRCRNDRTWTMLFLSDGFEAITGFDPVDFLDKGDNNFADLIHPDDVEVLWEKVQFALDDCHPYEFEYRLKTTKGDYKWVWEKGRGVYDGSGNLIFLEGFISDITWRKHNAEVQHVVFNIANAVNVTRNLSELLASIRNELVRIIDTENFFIALYDAEKETLSLPFMADKKDSFKSFPAGKTLTGYVIGNNKPLLIGEEEIREMAASGEIEIHGTVSKTWLGVPLQYREEIIGAIVVQNYEKNEAYSASDLEIMKFVSNQIALSIEKKKAEDELRLAKEKAIESDKLKTAFLANMSHEIRTPMNAIIGFSDLLADPGLSESERKNFTNIIQNNGNVLLTLIDDIIDMAKLEAGQLRIEKQSVNINEVLDELFSYFNEYRHKMNKSDIEIRYPQFRSGKVELKTDALRFRQIISNLINNALKFTESGYIEIGYRFTEPDKSEERDSQRSVIVWVKDTGVGIPEDKINLVFDRFRQAYDSHSRIFGGTGLGLTISKNLAELLGGKIWVESKPGQGTTFHISLPADELTEITSSYKLRFSEKTEIINGQGLRVLIVEDEPASAYFLKTLIEKTGAITATAVNGHEAVSLFENNHTFDIVFMDIRMPEMDGYEATRIIKEKHPQVPVIAQTAFAMPEEIARSKEAGCDGHINKPLKSNEVFAVIRKFSKQR